MSSEECYCKVYCGYICEDCKENMIDECHCDLEDNIQNIPTQVVNDFISWATEDLNEHFDNNSKDFNQMKSQINYENIECALISFMMYSLKNRDEYLDDFKETGWNGFELYGSGSGRQVLSIIHGCDF